MHRVIQTHSFAADAKAAKLSEAKIEEIELTIAADPEAGTLIQGTGGVRKLRFPGRGKGKSGGYRVVYFYGPVDVPVFLLILIDKGDEEDIGQAVRNALKAECDELIKEYRASVRSKARAHRARAQREGKR